MNKPILWIILALAVLTPCAGFAKTLYTAEPRLYCMDLEALRRMETVSLKGGNAEAELEELAEEMVVKGRCAIAPIGSGLNLVTSVPGALDAIEIRFPGGTTTFYTLSRGLTSTPAAVRRPKAAPFKPGARMVARARDLYCKEYGPLTVLESMEEVAGTPDRLGFIARLIANHDCVSLDEDTRVEVTGKVEGTANVYGVTIEGSTRSYYMRGSRLGSDPLSIP